MHDYFLLVNYCVNNTIMEHNEHINIHASHTSTCLFFISRPVPELESWLLQREVCSVSSHHSCIGQHCAIYHWSGGGLSYWRLLDVNCCTVRLLHSWFNLSSILIFLSSWPFLLGGGTFPLEVFKVGILYLYPFGGGGVDTIGDIFGAKQFRK